ncbi:hypothetical protein BVC80_8287g8 [Macleaya cordata]|uniref:Protein preY n=1 Tax=Macleaya cordata TaxID=56857 RepID=A0A200PZP5_MACCD|nr:hypothetical protein BVC80_8287g8 [Macleaya cordata]
MDRMVRVVVVGISSREATGGEAGTGVAGAETTIISETLSEILVCPLSKQPLRRRLISRGGGGGGESDSVLISGALGVSYPGFCDFSPYFYNPYVD